MHGGGFYHPQKYLVAPKTLPEHLHWFYWESYSTWLTGFALFTVLYLFNAGTLPDRQERPRLVAGRRDRRVARLPRRLLARLRRDLPRASASAQHGDLHRRRAGVRLRRRRVVARLPACSPAAPRSCSSAR